MYSSEGLMIPQQDKGLWFLTKYTKLRLSDPQNREIVAALRERHAICRDTPIDGGIDFSHWQPEIIVVDSEKDIQLMECYHTLIGILRQEMSKAAKLGAAQQIKNTLRIVTNFVYGRIPYDSDCTNKLRKSFPNKQKIYLSSFFHGGVCRHQSLLLGFLIEKLIADKYLVGSVSIDKNYVLGEDNAHAWVRYSNRNIGVVIIDAAQSPPMVIDLDTLVKKYNNIRYSRPEDLNALRRVAKLVSATLKQLVGKNS